MADFPYASDNDVTLLRKIAENTAELAIGGGGPVVSVNGQTGIVQITNISGNSATATALQNARTINGVSFNGTADIAISAGALTGSTLAASVVASSLTSAAGGTFMPPAFTPFATIGNFGFYKMAVWGDSLAQNLNPSLPNTITNYVCYMNGVGGEGSYETLARVLADVPSHAYVNLVWTGHNNYANPTQVISDLDAIVAALGTNTQFLILTILNGGDVNTWIGHTGYDQIMTINNHILSTYPNNSFDIRAYLVAQYNPLIPQDVIDHDNDTVPSSLRQDSIHLTNAGSQLVSTQVSIFTAAHFGSPLTTTVVSAADLKDFATAPAPFGNIYLQSAGSIWTGATKLVAANTTLGHYFFGGAGNATATGTKLFGFGKNALKVITSGGSNCAFGDSSLQALTTGSTTTAFGVNTGFNQVATTGGVFLGYGAGFYETASDKLFIDDRLRASESDARVKALIYGVFNDATASQSLRVNGTLSTAGAISSDAGITSTGNAINGAAGTYRTSQVKTAGSTRWAWGANDTAESGANAGSDWVLYSFDDAGSILTNPVIRATRSTGVVTFTGPIAIGNGTVIKSVKSTAVNLVGGEAIVTDASILSSTAIFPNGVVAVGGTPGAIYISARTTGSGYTVKSTSATDTSSVSVLLINF